MRISLLAAALMAAGLVMAAKTTAQRAHAPSAHLRYAPSPPAAPAPPRAAADKNSSPVIGSIHYLSDEHSTTVTIGLPELVFFDAHRLSRPDRIYFDVQGTRMPASLHGRVIQVEVEETFLRKIRVAEWKPGVTRIVLEIPPSCAYSAMIASDPYRLIVKLHAPE